MKKGALRLEIGACGSGMANLRKMGF